MIPDLIMKDAASIDQSDDKAPDRPGTEIDDRPTLFWVQVADLEKILDSETYLVPSQMLREMDWKVILTQSSSASKEISMNNGLLIVPRSTTYLLGQVSMHIQIMRWLFSHDEVDIVMFHDISSAWFLPIPLLYRLAGRRRPLFVKDSRTFHMGSGTQGIKDRLRSLYYRYSHRLADLWVDGHLAITPRIAEALGVSSERLLGVWPSGVDPSKFKAAHETRCWPGEDEPVRLVYIGSIHSERNLSTLCRAVIAATNQGMKFALTIVGRGAQQAELEELASTTNGIVVIRPAVPHDEVWKVLADAHIGVLPFPDELKFRVSSPIKLFEYMAAGMPILATRIVCHTDVVGEGEFVFWADGSDQEALVDALKQIWVTRWSLPELGIQAVEAVDQWTWEASSIKLATALKALKSKEQS